MVLGMYFLIAFVVFFFLWKKYTVPAIAKKGQLDNWIDLLGFHIAFWGSLFWILTIPMILIWKFLEKITGK